MGSMVILYQQHVYITEQLAKINQRIQRQQSKPSAEDTKVASSAEPGQAQQRTVQRQLSAAGDAPNSDVAKQRALMQTLRQIESLILEWNYLNFQHQPHPYHSPAPLFESHMLAHLMQQTDSPQGYAAIIPTGRPDHNVLHWQTYTDFSSMQTVATPTYASFRYPYEVPLQTYHNRHHSQQSCPWTLAQNLRGGAPSFAAGDVPSTPDSGYGESPAVDKPLSRLCEQNNRSTAAMQMFTNRTPFNDAERSVQEQRYANMSSVVDEPVSPTTTNLILPAGQPQGSSAANAEDSRQEGLVHDQHYSAAAVDLIESRLKRKRHYKSASAAAPSTAARPAIRLSMVMLPVSPDRSMF